MSRPKLGIGLILAGLAVVAIGVVAKRAYGQRTLMIVLHTLASVVFLIPGIMVLVYRPNPGERESRPS